MKKAVLLLFMSVIVLSGKLSAQLTGIKLIPGDYPTLAAAITDLNTQGVGPGGVIFMHMASETAPAGGYQITTTTSTAADPVVISGNGNTITASAAHTAGSLNDAIFKIIGADYIGIQGYIMQENPANTNNTPATNNMTEWGVALLHASVTNGAQGNVIMGNTISLNRTYSNTWGIYSNSRHSATNISAANDPTSAAGANSDNSILQNTISEVNMPIAFIGSGTAAFMDMNNLVGSATMGNVITNWGGLVPLSTYLSNSNIHYGILMNHQVGSTVRGNTIATTITPTATFRGISQVYTVTAPTVAGTNNICANTISIVSTAASGAMQAIAVANGSNSSALVLDSNTVQNCSVSHPTSTTTLVGVTVNTALASAQIRSNRILNNTSTTNAGGFTGISVSASLNGNSSINDNQIGNATTDAITFSAGTNGAVVGISFSGGGSAGAGIAISGNIFHGIVFNTTASSTVDLISNTGTLNFNFINNNTFDNISLATVGAITMINNNMVGGSSSFSTISSNVITGSFSKTVNSANPVTLISGTGASAAGATRTVANNIFPNVSTVNGVIIGINESGGASTGAVVRTITGNSFTGWNSGSNITGVLLGTAGGASSVSGNTVSNCVCASIFMGVSVQNTCNGSPSFFTNTFSTITAGAECDGISISATPTFTALEIAGNVIGPLSSTSATFGVQGLILAANGGLSIHDNTIFDLNSICSTQTVTNGIFLTHNAGAVSVYSNKIYDVENVNAAGNSKGIQVTNCDAIDIYNNYIGHISAPLSNGMNAVNGINITAGTTVNVSYNTIYLTNVGGGTNSGAIAFRTTTAPNVALRNNLFVNLSTATGTGIVAAYVRGSTTLTTYDNASNNNSFYAGVPSATNLIFSDGTNSDQTLAQFQTRVGPARDAQSVSENPTFSSVTGSDPDYLHIPFASVSLLESGGVAIAGITADWDTDTRPGPVGSVNGGALAPDIGADEFDGILAGCSGTPTAGTAITTSPASQCEGSSFDLELSGHSTGAAFTYQWQESSVSGGPYTNISGATNDTYTTAALTGTMYYVCVVTCTVSGLSATSTEVAAVINPTPVITFSPAAPSLCDGAAPVNIVASGANTYSWTPGTGLSSTTVNNPDANPAATTTYTVTGTSLDGCTGTNTITVTVNPLPTVAINASPDPLCAGETVTLTGSGADTYIWEPMFTSGTSVTDNPASTTSYTVTGTDANGCTNTASITVTVNPAPTVTASADFTTVCSGSPVQLTGGGASTYLWNPGAISGSPVTVNPTGNITYTVVGTDVNGCTASDMVSITVNPAPPVGVSASSTTICDGETTTLTGSGADTYTWMPGSLSGTSVIVSPTSTTTYIVTGTDLNGCTSTATITITVNPLPVVSVSGAGSYCQSGSTTLTSSAGTSYQWYLNGVLIAGETAQTISANTPGIYNVIVTLPTGCADSAATGHTLIENPNPSVSFTASPSLTICAGSSITLSGTGAVTYTWSGGISDGVAFTPAVSGDYTVTGTDASGCTNTAVASVVVQPGPSVTASASATSICESSSTMLMASGADTYLWMPGSLSGANVIVFPASTTTYTVTGTDLSGCTNTATITITVNPRPTVSISGAGSYCQGGSTILTSSAGTTYQWYLNGVQIGGETSQTITATAPGIYNVMVSLPTGCADSASTGHTLIENPSPTVSFTAMPSLAVCAGSSITLSGTGAVTYTWSGGVTDGVAFVPPASGSYTVTGTDALGCTNTAVATVTVIPVPTVSFVATPGTTVCAETVVTLTGTGASSYTWSGGISDAVPFTPGTTTTYTVTGTDINGCTNTAMATITVNPTPTITITASPGTTICAGDAVTLSGSGASSYSWTGGVTDGVPFTPASTTTYTVTGTDGNGCTSAATVTVTVNPTPTVGFTASPGTTVCEGTSVTLDGTGATSYSWSGGIFDGVPFTAVSTTTYTVTGTNVAGCSSTATVTITVNPAPTVGTSAAPSATVCAGNALTLNGTGATSYTWSGGVTDGISFVPPATTTYTVTGTDGNGCTNTATILVTVNPAPTVGATASPGTSVCTGSSVTLNGTGATSYSWSGGVIDGVAFVPPSTTSYVVTGTDASGCTNTATITITVNPLPTVSSTANPAGAVCEGTMVTLSGSGASSYVWTGGVSDGVPFAALSTQTYTVTGTDGNGCTNTATTTVTVNPAPAVTASASPGTSVCTGTSVTLTGGGATTYTWTGGVNDGVAFTPVSTNTYTVTGSDAIGCTNTATITITVNPQPNISSTASPGVTVCAGTAVTLNGTGGASYTWTGGVTDGVPFTPASTQTYTVTGTDVNGCTNTATTTITVVPAPTITSAASPSTMVCEGTMVTLNGFGGSSYSWSGGVTDGVPFAATATTTYTVIGTDANGCTGTNTITINVNLAPNISAAQSPAGPHCAGSTVTLNGIGGISYTWCCGVVDGVGFVPASTATYTVTGSDFGGCTSTATITVVVNPSPVVSSTAAPATTVCSGTPVTLNGTGATTYTWTGGVTNGVPFTPVSTNTYTVTGTDANGCTNTATTTITVNPTPTVSSTAAPSGAVCAGGSVTLSGTGAVTYTWSGGVTDGVAFVPLATTTYTVTGTAANGCTATAVNTVTVNPLPTVSSNTSPSSLVCSGTQVTLSGTGATTYVWSGGVTDNVPFTAVTTNTYTVTGTDANGCTNTATTTVTVNTSPTVSFNASPSNTVCVGTEITLDGTGAVTYTWSDGIIDGNPFTPAVTDTVTVIGTDANGCEDTATVIITVNTPPVVTTAYSPSDTVCENTQLTLMGQGASTYVWSHGVTDNVAFAATATTTYTVIGTDGNGCSDTTTQDITVIPAPVVMITGNSTFCTGGSTVLTSSAGMTYQWYMNGSPVAGATSSTYSATVAGVYNVWVTNANGCGDSSAVSVNVTINAAPTVTANATATSICDGNSVTLSGSGAVSYAWSGGVNNNVPFTPLGTVTYTVVGTASNGCTDSDTITVTVNPLPVVSTSGFPAYNVCEGTAVTLNGNGAATYTWTGGVVDGVPFTPTVTDTYTVTGTDLAGCSNTATVTVTVNPNPVVNLGPDSTQCGSIMLDAGNAGSTYMWNTSATTQTINATVSGTYMVDVTTLDGCTSSDTVVVTINTQPVVALGADDTLCAASVMLDAMNAGGTYIWNDMSTGQTNVVTTSGTYFVEVTMPGGCIASDTINLVLHTPPTVTLTLPIDTACLNMGSVALGGESPAGGTWSGPAVSGNSFDPMIAGIGTFGITYMYTDTNGCSGSVVDSILVDPCLSIVEPVVAFDFNMYPNPNNGEFSITVDGNETVQVLIYNGAGQIVIDQQVNAGEITPVSLEASGIYMVTVITNDGQQLTKRVVVNR